MIELTITGSNWTSKNEGNKKLELDLDKMKVRKIVVRDKKLTCRSMKGRLGKFVITFLILLLLGKHRMVFLIGGN